MSVAQAQRPLSMLASEGRLQLASVLRALVAQRLLDPADAERLRMAAASTERRAPLSVIADMNFRSPADRRLLDLETLTQWLADEAQLPYQHIDPLRVDFTRVVEVMSSAYATTYSILPVAVSASEVTIATSEPFLGGWEREIEQITKRAVRKVVASPLDVARYTTEFYKLAASVRAEKIRLQSLKASGQVTTAGEVHLS